MTKKNKDPTGLAWLERLDPDDTEQLAAFRAWLERGADDPKRCLTVRDAMIEWQRLIEQRKMH